VVDRLLGGGLRRPRRRGVAYRDRRGEHRPFAELRIEMCLRMGGRRRHMEFFGAVRTTAVFAEM
jgi:hypothetical protein